MKNLKKIALPALMFIFGAAATLTYVNLTGCSGDEAAAVADQGADAAGDTVTEDTAAEVGDTTPEVEVTADDAAAPAEVESTEGGDTEE